jgi:hypothetical protein
MEIILDAPVFSCPLEPHGCYSESLENMIREKSGRYEFDRFQPYQKLDHRVLVFISRIINIVGSEC